MKAGGGENGEGRVVVQYLPCQRDLVMAYKVTPLSPYPITSPGRSAGVGGERTGQNSPFSHLATPPQHSQSWKLSGPELQMDCAGMRSYSSLMCASSCHPAFFDLETR